MNENLAVKLIQVLDRNAAAMERVAEAQEESNKIMREDIQLIRDEDLNSINFDGLDG